MYGKGGHVEEGLCLLAEALAMVDRTGLRYAEVDLYYLRGRLLLTQSSGNHAEAEACWHQALTIARRQQAKSFELCAATSLSRLWLQQGKQAESRELLTGVYNWFTEGFDTRDLRAWYAKLRTGSRMIPQPPRGVVVIISAPSSARLAQDPFAIDRVHEDVAIVLAGDPFFG